MKYSEFINLLRRCSNYDNIEYIGLNYTDDKIKYLKEYYKSRDIPFRINSNIINELICDSFLMPFDYSIYSGNNSVGKSVGFLINEKNNDRIITNIEKIFYENNFDSIDNTVVRILSELTNKFDFVSFFPLVLDVKMVNEEVGKISIYVNQMYKGNDNIFFVNNLQKLRENNKFIFSNDEIFMDIINNIKLDNAKLFLFGFDIDRYGEYKYKIYLQKYNNQLVDNILNKYRMFFGNGTSENLHKILYTNIEGFSVDIIMFSDKGNEINIYFKK